MIYDEVLNFHEGIFGYHELFHDKMKISIIPLIIFLSYHEKVHDNNGSLTFK